MTEQWPSQGNYTDYREYWTKRIANELRWPLRNVAVEAWNSCDPVHRREVAQWEETFTSAANQSQTINMRSTYLIEFDADLNATRQALWTSGNLLHFLQQQTQPAALPAASTPATPAQGPTVA